MIISEHPLSNVTVNVTFFGPKLPFQSLVGDLAPLVVPSPKSHVYCGTAFATLGVVLVKSVGFTEHNGPLMYAAFGLSFTVMVLVIESLHPNSEVRHRVGLEEQS